MTGLEIANAIDDFLETIDKKDYPCVNWGDMSCTCVKQVEEIYPEDHEYYVAVIEEADPQNYELAEIITTYMADKYGIDIYINCEW